MKTEHVRVRIDKSMRDEMEDLQRIKYPSITLSELIRHMIKEKLNQEKNIIKPLL